MNELKYSVRQNSATPAHGQTCQGLVISHLGKGLAVEDEQGVILLCHTRRQLGAVAVGDRVIWERCGEDQGRVLEILPRRNLLARPGHNDKLRSVAANLDQVVIVIALAPEPDWLLVDQYLAACEHRSFGALIVLNKCDLDFDGSAVRSELAVYDRAGYAWLAVSARTENGLPELRGRLTGHCSILAGQSGVGKSSLTNTLLPDRQSRTRELSEKSGLGRHTTTTATLYHLADGGDLIDSPGVAVFGLAEFDAKILADAYREFRPWISRCQFNDCQHLNDKGCAVREAVENLAISPSRYQRFLKLREKLPSAASRR